MAESIIAKNSEDKSKKPVKLIRRGYAKKDKTGDEQ